MSTTSRDTQFAGFAEALFENLPWNEINIDMEWPGWQEKWELYIARRAYDLVEHSFSGVREFQPHATILSDEEEKRYIRDNVMPQIPDLTELPKEQELDRAELNKRLDYLKMAHPESAESIQQAQNFIEAMVEIQTSTGPSIGELGAVSEAINAMAKEQEV